MMKFILITILVTNGRSYTETPIYGQTYKTEAECVTETKDARYANLGTVYKKAVCVPLVPNSGGQQ